jgi:hypothetical protein
VTSSIYPQPVSIDFVGFVTSLSVTSSSGYSGTATVTFDGDTDPVGILAVANATIDVAGTVSSITVTNEGAGYTSVPSITIEDPVSGTTATATANLSNGKVISITITNPGSGYTSSSVPSIIIGTGSAPVGVRATAIATINGGEVDSITLSTGGSGYITLPTVNVTGSGGGSNAVIAVTIASLTSSVNILKNNIVITNSLVFPGGGGILRLYFAFVFDTSPGTIVVFNNDVAKGALNADNDSQIITNGYYRFDIDVEADDSINLKLESGTGSDLLSVNFLRAHLVQFGA